MYGSFLTEAYGFRITADIVAIICLVFVTVYFFIAGGAQAFKTTCTNTSESDFFKIERDEFFKMKAEDGGNLDETQGARSRGSSFMMIEKTSSGVSE